MTALLEATAISKSFGSNTVLDDVSISIASGEILSVVGENGAGKSTFAKILSGIVAPDSGSLHLSGNEVHFTHPREAIDAGIGIVHQELCLAENLTVTENLLLGREKLRYGLFDRLAMKRVALTALERLGVTLNPNRLVSTLSAAERQMVEIARVLSYDAKLLIFDEPTSSLSDTEAHALLELIKRLKRDGVSILYVSHRLPEVQEISDRVIALRDGKNSGELKAPMLQRDKLIHMIVGRDIQDLYGYHSRPIGAAALELKNFRASPRHTPCDITVRAGEIVGITGLIGSGRTEILEGIFGITPPVSGTIRVCGKELSAPSPVTSSALGISLLPESRKEQGIIAESSLCDNVIISMLTKGGNGIFREKKTEREIALCCIESLRIRCSGPEQLAHKLSGGNQQKVVLGRCLATHPQVLLLDEPTRGVDVGARREIYSILFELAAKGLAILFVSSELEEVIGLADRVLVISDGQLRGELSREELSEHAIMALASPQSRIAI